MKIMWLLVFFLAGCSTVFQYEIEREQPVVHIMRQERIRDYCGVRYNFVTNTVTVVDCNGDLEDWINDNLQP